MDIKNICQEALKLGISIRFLAKRINRDHTTLSKWLRGERELSEEIQHELINTLRELRDSWDNIPM